MSTSDPPSHDRRRARRRSPAPDEPIAYGRLRTGGPLAVLDVSDCGVAVTCADRLPPGRSVDVHVVTPSGRILVRARVVRCRVVAVSAHELRFEAALSFVDPIDTRPAGNVLPRPYAHPLDSGAPATPIDVSTSPG